MEWNSQQAKALDDIGRWISSGGSQVYYLAGYAGTGKTTLAKHIAAMSDGLVLFAAFTGKAASVLRRKGCINANTVHSYIYSPVDQDTKVLKSLRLELKTNEDLDEDEKEGLRLAIRAEQDRLKGPRFRLNPESLVRSASLVILDECSMINEWMGMDLLSFGVKVLVLGDPAQLPPVKGSGFFTKQKPDTLLTEIHRQARDNPIIHFATLVRKGDNIPFCDLGDAKRIKGTGNVAEIMGNAQILTGKNDIRRNINKKVRAHLGLSGTYPEEKEKLICLRNDKELGVLNGVLCEAHTDAVEVDGEEFIGLDLWYDDHLVPEVPADPGVFLEYVDPDFKDYLKGGFMDRSMLQLDFGYAITVHKSQGSQWEDVILCDDRFAHWNRALRRQWLYTGITRAEKRLTIIV